MTDHTTNLALPLMGTNQGSPDVIYDQAMQILDAANPSGGGITVRDVGSSPAVVVSNARELHFTGVTVTPQSNGVALIHVPVDSDTSSGGSLPAGGSIHQVLTKLSSANGDADWETPAAGGGGSGGSITPDTPPGSPTTFDDEFEAGTLNGRWAWFNQGATTASFADGALILGGSTDGANHALIQTAPATPWEFTAKVSLAGPGGGSGIACGLYAKNSSSNKSESFFLATASGPFVGYAFDGSGGYVATNYSNGNYPIGASADVDSWHYVRLVNDGTNLIFKASKTGIAGSFMTVATVALTYISAADQIGLCFNNNVATAIGAVDWFRRTA